VIRGIARGCEQAGCALTGGETAEHPKAFIPGEYDLAGFAVGVVEKSKAIDGTTIVPGDVLLGLASSGPHSNGFSLIRRILDVAHADLRAPLPGSAEAGTLGQYLLEPTRIYVKPVLALLESISVKGMAHITGGGLLENVHRMFPANAVAAIDRAAWPRPAIFSWLQRAGNVDEQEMLRTFNCGIGMVVVVAAGDADRAQTLLAAEGETVFRIGTVRERMGDEAQTQVT
jgi:phosphoribosylformylglycinamidine cyclo-ligase